MHDVFLIPQLVLLVAAFVAAYLGSPGAALLLLLASLFFGALVVVV